MTTQTGGLYLTEIRRAILGTIYQNVDMMNISKIDAIPFDKNGQKVQVRWQKRMTRPKTILEKNGDRVPKPLSIQGVDRVSFDYDMNGLVTPRILIDDVDNEKQLSDDIPYYGREQAMALTDHAYKIFSHNLGVEHPNRIVLTSGDARPSVLDGSMCGSVSGTRKKLTLADVLKARTLINKNSMYRKDDIYGAISPNFVNDLYEIDAIVNANTVGGGEKHRFLTGDIKVVNLLGIKWMLKEDDEYTSPAVYEKLTNTIANAALSGKTLIQKVDTTPYFEDVVIPADACGCITLWRRNAISQMRMGVKAYINKDDDALQGTTMSARTGFGVTRDSGAMHINNDTKFDYNYRYVDCDTVTIVEQWVS